MVSACLSTYLGGESLWGFLKAFWRVGLAQALVNVGCLCSVIATYPLLDEIDGSRT